MRNIRIERDVLIGWYVMSFKGFPAIGQYMKPLEGKNPNSRLLGHTENYVHQWPQSRVAPPLTPGALYMPKGKQHAAHTT